ncbi:MAG: type II toxin-antitoxin system death-on-curing family toxin [Myxococcota bacterium]
MQPRWLTKGVVRALHSELLTEFGGRGGVRDEGLLESALARPQSLLASQREVGLPRLAAAYGFGLARNHAFLDGNKRISVVSIAVFLSLNGLRFDPDELDEVRTIVALAAGELDEEALARWIGTNSVKSQHGR